MMQIYDDPTFYKAYSEMDRSRFGLSASGEWYMLEKLFPKLKGAAVLDLGCGYGWHSKYCAEHGASFVLGIDASKAMIGEAKKRNADNKVGYWQCAIEEYGYPADSYDFVLSNLALHYVKDLDAVYRNVYRTLKPGGIFLFNIEHPTFTASPGQDWVYRDGKPEHWPVDRYYEPGERDTAFLGCPVKKYHHTLTQIVDGMITAGFTLEAVQEVVPSKEMRIVLPDEMRRPMMLLVRGRKGEKA